MAIATIESENVAIWIRMYNYLERSVSLDREFCAISIGCLSIYLVLTNGMDANIHIEGILAVILVPGCTLLTIDVITHSEARYSM